MAEPENKLIGSTYRTTYHWLKKDFLHFEREHQFAPPHVETDVYGQFWMLWLFEIRKGEVAISRHGLHWLEGQYALLIPPFSIIEWHVRAEALNWQGYAWPDVAPSAYPAHLVRAALFRQVFQRRPENPGEILGTLASEQPLMVIEKEERGDARARAVKGYLDRHFEEELKISDAAKTLRMRNYEIGRIFKKEYGINPVVYLQKLRIMNAIHSLLFQNPENVSSVAFENGFSDLSRFNKNFLKLSGSTPSQHLRMASRYQLTESFDSAGAR